LIGCVFGLAALSLLVHVKLLVLALGYAVATVAAGFAVATVADHLAQETAREHVLAADEHGAILADDPAALASALRTLHESDATAIPRANHVGRSTDSHVVADERNVLAALADCPTDRVPLDDRITALEGLQDRLDDRATREPADALSNASS